MLIEKTGERHMKKRFNEEFSTSGAFDQTMLGVIKRMHI